VAVILVLPTVAAVATAIRRRRPPRLAMMTGRAVHLPTQPGWTAAELLEASDGIVLDVIVTDIVTVDDDLLVAFAGGPGAWYRPCDVTTDPITLVRPVSWVEASIALQVPSPFLRRQALETVARWRAGGAELQAFVSVRLGLVGLLNPATGEIFASPLESSVSGRV